VQEELDKLKALFASCKCGDHDKCKQNLKTQVQNQLDAIARAENAKLQHDVREGYLDSETEQKAREKQVEYLKDKQIKSAASAVH
jgi:hypothetical protein